MASRQEEKERRRQERLAREQAEAAAAKRKRLAQIVGGVVVAAAIVVGLVIAASGGGKDGSGPQTGSSGGQAAIPARKITDLDAAAKAAGCVLTNPAIEGSTHVPGKVKYKSNPPSSGNHNPVWAKDGNYAGIAPPAKENYVHALEHGRIEIQYKPGLDKHRVAQLETLFAESTKTDSGLDSVNGGFTLLFENNTGMPYEVAATAWGHILGCKTFNDKVFDAIRAFRTRYVLKAPEYKPDPE